MCTQAHVVSVHCPLTPATRGMIDAEVLASLPPGAHLVNCARGPIVDRAALAAALESGHLGGAGLDVYREEPWDPSDPLLLRDDVVTMPHIAGSTREAFARERLPDVAHRGHRGGGRPPGAFGRAAAPPRGVAPDRSSPGAPGSRENKRSVPPRTWVDRIEPLACARWGPMDRFRLPSEDLLGLAHHGLRIGPLVQTYQGSNCRSPHRKQQREQRR